MAEEKIEDSGIEVNGLRLWKKWEKTEKAFTKKFDNGSFKGTDINPTYRARKMSEHVGPYGVGWGLQNVRFEIIPGLKAEERLVVCHAEVWYIDPDTGEKAVCGPHTGCDYLIRETKNGMRTDVEVFKKVQTDAMTSAFRFLGISADVYMGLWDNSRYQAMLGKEGEIDLTDFMGEEPKKEDKKEKKPAAAAPPKEKEPAAPPAAPAPPATLTEEQQLVIDFKRILAEKIAHLEKLGLKVEDARVRVIKRKDELKAEGHSMKVVLEKLEADPFA